jgi:hypothetical protein
VAGQEATTFDDWLDEVIILTMTIDESYWKGSLRLDSQHRWVRYLAQLYCTVPELENCTCSDHTGSNAITEPHPTALGHFGRFWAAYSPWTSPRYKASRSYTRAHPVSDNFPARQAFVPREFRKKRSSSHQFTHRTAYSDTTKKKAKRAGRTDFARLANDQAAGNKTITRTKGMGDQREIIAGSHKFYS